LGKGWYGTLKPRIFRSPKSDHQLWLIFCPLERAGSLHGVATGVRMSVEELLAAASVLAMAVDSDGEDGMELEDACGGAAAASPASDVVEVEEETIPGVPAGQDDGAAKAKVFAHPTPLHRPACELSHTF
jgi:hypothetical protein